MEEDNFYEEQKFTQKWILFLIYSPWVLCFFASLMALLQKKAGLFTAILPFVAISVIVLLFKSLKLQTRITVDGIYYRFFPVQRMFRAIKKSDIEKLEVKTYDPLSEYGGWGIGRRGHRSPAMGTEHRGTEMEEGARHLRSPSARRC